MFALEVWVLIMRFLPPEYRIFVREYLGLPQPVFSEQQQDAILRAIVRDDAYECLVYLVETLGWSLARGYTTEAAVTGSAGMMRYCFARDYSLYGDKLEQAVVARSAFGALDALPLYPWKYDRIIAHAWGTDNEQWVRCAVGRLGVALESATQYLWAAGVPAVFPKRILRVLMQHCIPIPRHLEENLILLGVYSRPHADAEVKWTLQNLIQTGSGKLSARLCDAIRSSGYPVDFIPRHLCECGRFGVHGQ